MSSQSKCTLNFDVTMMSSCVVALLDLMFRIKEAHYLAEILPKTQWKQECIPVGCVPTAYWPYSRVDCIPCVCGEGDLPKYHVIRQTPRPARQEDPCEQTNITFPLRMRSVMKEIGPRGGRALPPPSPDPQIAEYPIQIGSQLFAGKE